MAFQYAHKCAGDFPTPRKQVLLLTCMDLRLLDNTVAFMNELNLTNRYDQLALAGAALGVLKLDSPPLGARSQRSNSVWKDVFFHHLQVAIDVLHREIKDVFILEHRDCGAYKYFHPTHKRPYGSGRKQQKLEAKHHRQQASRLARRIDAFCRKQQQEAEAAALTAKRRKHRWQAEQRAEAWKGITTHSFLMDLRGNVKPLRRKE